MGVYNCERFVAEAIDSVLAQTMSDFEFIIVDDGSTDTTPSILAAYREMDSRIRVFKQHNQGVSGVMNRALAEAVCDLVAHLDADDRAFPNWLESQLSFLENHPKASVVCSYGRFINDKGRDLGSAGNPIDVARGIAEGDPSYFLDVIHSSVLMRTADVSAVGAYRMPNEMADRDLWGRLVTSGRQIYCNPVPLVQYRLHGKSLTVGIPSSEYLRRGIDINVRRRMRGESDLSPDELKAWFDRRTLPERVYHFYDFHAHRFFMNATRAYADHRWLSFCWSLGMATILRPWFVPIRVLRKLL
jgi:glycosyltransferase involved in cell wall biosynthesis